MISSSEQKKKALLALCLQPPAEADLCLRGWSQAVNVVTLGHHIAKTPVTFADITDYIQVSNVFCLEHRIFNLLLAVFTLKWCLVW